MGWRIRNGQRVNIWNDVWLPKLGNGRVAVQSINIKFTKVVDLIEVDNFQWKEEEIRRLLVPEQVDKVMCIPLVNPTQQDEIVWRGDNTGVYSIKGVYR